MKQPNEIRARTMLTWQLTNPERTEDGSGSRTGQRGGLLLGELGGEALERVVVALRHRQRRLLLVALDHDGRQHLQVGGPHHLLVAAGRAPQVDDIRLNQINQTKKDDIPWNSRATGIIKFLSN